MKTTAQSISFVEAVRRPIQGSIIIRSSVAAARLLTSARPIFSGSPAESSVVMTRLAPRVSCSGSVYVAPLADGSILLRTIERIFRLVQVAWDQSTPHIRIGAILINVSNVGATRARWCGWMVLTAATTHIMLVGIDALTVWPATGLGWIAVVPFALACITRPAAVVAAWNSFRSRRRHDRA